MGNKSSRRTQQYGYPQFNTSLRYGPPAFPPPSPYPSSYAGSQFQYDRTSVVQSQRYTHIADNYSSLDEVSAALLQAGLESSNLIVGIDFTKSNEWTGSRSFNHKSLHHLGGTSQNPYEQAISIIGRTLSAFDEDNLIPCYGFGDASTHDQEVFSFFPNERPCNGFEEVLSRYRELVPNVCLAGPTSFAPIIDTAIRVVDNSAGQYHVLLIIVDGQVTRSIETSYGQLSPQEKNTMDAIVRASKYPLSIVLVGVGDGPWDTMRRFDDNIPARDFDNLQFVNFTEIMSKAMPASKKEKEFALKALMEIPSQYKATIDLHLLGCRRGHFSKPALPPPARANYVPESPRPSSHNPRASAPTTTYYDTRSPYPQSHGFEQQDLFQFAPPPPPPENAQNNRLCPLCFWGKKDLALGCGHQTCYDCGMNLPVCTICATRITTRIRLFE
ncbi:hypothetical protein QQ045_010320 [Rhodiola kirilowii]